MSAGFESKTSRPFRTCVHCARLRYELGRAGSLGLPGVPGRVKVLYIIQREEQGSEAQGSSRHSIMLNKTSMLVPVWRS